MNIPYVKQYNEEGVLTNPIKGFYPNQFPNRKARKETRDRKWGGSHPKERFMGNRKGISLSIVGALKYRRFIQWALDEKTGDIKRIEHYLLKGVNY